VKDIKKIVKPLTINKCIAFKEMLFEKGSECRNKKLMKPTRKS
jgi:hypothetical protein